MKQEGFISAAQAHRTAVREFAARHAQTCSCPNLQLREETGLLRCARCDAPVIRRSRPVVRDLKFARIELALRELRALYRTAGNFETEVLVAEAVGAVVHLDRHMRKAALRGPT